MNFKYCSYHEMVDKMLENFIKVADMPQKVIEKTRIKFQLSWFKFSRKMV